MKKSLKEQIYPHTRHWDCYNDAPLEYDHTGKVLKIIDNLVVNFADWCGKNYFLHKSEASSKWVNKNGKEVSSKELLLKFKKQFKL